MSGESTESDGLDARDPGEVAEEPKGQNRTFGRRAMILGAAAGVGATAALVAGARPAFAADSDGASVRPGSRILERAQTPLPLRVVPKPLNRTRFRLGLR
jgi:hypothetical protein